MSKKIFIAALFILAALSFNADAANVTLSWDGVSQATGYKIYWGWGTSGKYTASVDVGNVTTYTLANLDTGSGGIWYSAATAYTKDTAGKIIESAYSNEVSVPFPGKPTTYKYTIIIAP